MKDRLPDFIIIGTQRGGTTSLYEYLAAHPDIAPAKVKEVHYFSFNYDKGDDWYRKVFPRRMSGSRKITGEASPYYLFDPDAPARAAELVPSAKLIALLRDPVERAYSHWQHERKKGHELLSFDEAIEAEPGRLAGGDPHELRHHSYAARGAYAEQLERWWARYPREQMLVLRSEDLFGEPERTHLRTLEFLGVRAVPLGGYPKLNASAPSDVMTDEVRVRLRERFRPLNARLRDLLGCDLGWQ